MKTSLSILAILAMATPALAGDCGWGHKMSAEVVAQSTAPEAEMPAVTVADAPMVVATVDCSTLTGDAATACLAASE